MVVYFKIDEDPGYRPRCKQANIKHGTKQRPN